VENNTRARLPRLAWPGRRARVHDMRVNGPRNLAPRLAGARLPFAILFFVAWMLSLES
jgi:hypothetical protein